MEKIKSVYIYEILFKSKGKSGLLKSECRYIGKSKDPYIRIKQHKNKGKIFEKAKKIAPNFIIADLQIIRVFNDENQALKIERELIKNYSLDKEIILINEKDSDIIGLQKKIKECDKTIIEYKKSYESLFELFEKVVKIKNKNKMCADCKKLFEFLPTIINYRKDPIYYKKYSKNKKQKNNLK